ncbi:interleukin-17D isoform X2 [Nycticebus coucang]|uniref:interleukin-17D isoform X2 n=1 Tax=Nycticebus coucang TaxID=9470 RepID=UPI00234D53A9|nr:interleukin-17D isoform X2 [Nycticebus coucang]
MLGTLVWMLVAGFLLALPPCRAAGTARVGRRPARQRSCADRPEELLEQLYGRLAAGVFGAFHHTLQLGPREQARNASCPAGGRPADRRFRPPTNLRSVSPWAYRDLWKSPPRELTCMWIVQKYGQSLSRPWVSETAGVEAWEAHSEPRISYDPKRYPKYLPEAYCLCRGCLTGLFGEEDLRFRSAPVYVPTVVLRRTAACAGGRAVYTEDYVTIPVGCTCVPEQEKDADSLNSSIDKQGAKLLLGPHDEPARP